MTYVKRRSGGNSLNLVWTDRGVEGLRRTGLTQRSAACCTSGRFLSWSLSLGCQHPRPGKWPELNGPGGDGPVVVEIGAMLDAGAQPVE
jgi:hypothetical protein